MLLELVYVGIKTFSITYYIYETIPFGEVRATSPFFFYRREESNGCRQNINHTISLRSYSVQDRQ